MHEISLEVVLMTFGLIALGLVLVWLVGIKLGLGSTGIVASLLFLPLLTYMIASGQIESFKAPGFEAKIRDLKNRNLSTTLANAPLETRILVSENVLQAGLAKLQAGLAKKHSCKIWSMSWSSVPTREVVVPKTKKLLCFETRRT